MFVVRARRVAAHSLAKDRGVLEGYTLKWHFQTDPDGRVTLHRELPDEERFESFAARIRPLTLKTEPLWYSKVIDAISRSVQAAGRPLDGALATDFENLQAAWRRWDIENLEMRGYVVQLGGGHREEVLTATDAQLGAGWFYADVAHADPKSGKKISLEYGLDDRYTAAVAVFSGLALVVLATLDFVKHLNEAGYISLPDSAWSTPVEAQTGQVAQEMTAFVAPAGTPIPSIGEPRGPDWTELSYESTKALLGIFHVTAQLIDAQGSVVATYPAVTRRLMEDQQVVGVDLRVGDVLDIRLPRPGKEDERASFNFRTAETNRELVELLTVQQHMANLSRIEVQDDQGQVFIRLRVGSGSVPFTASDQVALEAGRDLIWFENTTGKQLPVLETLPPVEELIRRRILRLVLSGHVTFGTSTPLTASAPRGIIPRAIQTPESVDVVGTVSIDVPSLILWHPEMLVERQEQEGARAEDQFVISIPQGERFRVWAPDRQDEGFDPSSVTPTGWGLDAVLAWPSQSR